MLLVGAQDAVRKLVRDERLTRHTLAGQFLYCGADCRQQGRQPRARRLLLATPGVVRRCPMRSLMPAELRAAIVLFASLVDERQRRLFAGLESLKCGWGVGDRRVAILLGNDLSTVGTADDESSSGTMSRSTGCVARRADGGRRERAPEVIARLEAVMVQETAGDPLTGLKWTPRTTAKTGGELRALGIDIWRTRRRQAPQGPGRRCGVCVGHSRLSFSTRPRRRGTGGVPQKKLDKRFSAALNMSHGKAKGAHEDCPPDGQPRPPGVFGIARCCR